MDKRGGRLAVVVAGYEKKVYEEILGFNTGMLANRIRRRFELSDFSDPELIELLESELERTRPAYHVADDKHVRIAARRVEQVVHEKGAPLNLMSEIPLEADEIEDLMNS